MSGPGNPDFFQSLDREDTDQLIEFIEQLQSAVDATQSTDERLRLRIEDLERDRETLRDRVEQLRADLQRITGHPAGRVARRLTRPAASTPSSLRPTDVPRDDGVHPETAMPDGPVVATILDPISDACWSPEFDPLRLDRMTWGTQLEERRPEVLFVESAFMGANGSWSRRISHFGSPHEDLVDLVHTARALGIPTVFWNKEDPVNYGWFIGAASLFDHVFTVDVNQVDRYRTDLGHDQIHVLPFAAQPTLHHPPDAADTRDGTIAFAGTYYARKHTGRRERMVMLLGSALDHDLVIYDRMAGSEDARFAWPEAFRSHIVGSVPYPDMGAVYRRHRAFINVNTVTDSPTMCARRIFELAACATPIVSDPAVALSSTVPPEVVTVVTDGDAAAAAYANLELEQPHNNPVGPSWIAAGNTYADRWGSITDVL